MNNKIIRTVFVAFSLLLINNIKAQDIYEGKITKVEKEISADFLFESKFLNLGADTVHYVESGEGDPIILLHGLPANVYLWRNIIPNIDSKKK